MNNETRDQDKSLTLSGPVVNLVVSAVLGAVLGGGGATIYQRYEPHARADAFTASDFKPWETEINRQAWQLDALDQRLRKIEATCQQNRSDVKEILTHISECDEYRKRDNEKMADLWREISLHTKSPHPPIDVDRQINRNSETIRRNTEAIERNSSKLDQVIKKR